MPARFTIVEVVSDWSALAIVAWYGASEAAPIARVTDSGPADAASRHTMPQSTTLGLYPVIHVPNYMDYYSFTEKKKVKPGTWYSAA